MLAVHAIAIVAIGAAVSLGLWQYDAWQARRAADAVDLGTLTPITLAEAMGPDDPFPGDKVGQPVVVVGTWLPDDTFVVDGRQLDGVDGSWVVTPVVIGDPATGSALPIVRGWIANPDPSLDSLPPAPTGRTELVAWLQPGEGTGEPDPDPSDDILPQLRLADVLARLDRDVYGGYGIVADRTGPGDWPVGAAAVNAGTADLQQASPDQLPPAPRFTALRNLLYALEWWFFGGFALFVWWRYVRDELSADEPAVVREGADPSPPGQ